MSGYKKHFLPLESNPDVFTELIHRLGAVEGAAFEDVLTLDEPELFPYPALAVVLVLPTTAAYEERKAAAEAARHEHNDHDEDAVIWFKQTINNACGLYAVLHALFNTDPSRLFEHSCLGKDFLDDCLTDGPRERALKLENHPGLEGAYAAVAAKGDSAVPSSAEDEVDYHYICFVRSNHDGCLYELDGDSKGPVCLGPVDIDEYGDILRPDTISQIRNYIDREESGNIGYSLMALVHHGILE